MLELNQSWRIVAHITSTCLFRRDIQKLARKLFQHAAGKNVGERSYDAERTCQTELRVCGITTQINARAVISNPAGKTNLGKNFQAYCSIDVGKEKEGLAYCCRSCKLKLETIVKKILEMRELFYKTSKEKVKRLHLPTGESPLAKKVCATIRHDWFSSSMRRQMILDPLSPALRDRRGGPELDYKLA